MTTSFALINVAILYCASKGLEELGFLEYIGYQLVYVIEVRTDKANAVFYYRAIAESFQRAAEPSGNHPHPMGVGFCFCIHWQHSFCGCYGSLKLFSEM